MKYIAITKQNINGIETNSVLLRDLHTMLGVKGEFANWFKDQSEILETYEDGKDYIRTATDRNGATLIVKAGLNLRGKQSEYIITLDMAKHLCMLSRTDKGKEARQYFINVEKQFQKDQNLQLDIQMQRLDALTSVAHASKEILNSHDKRLSNLEKNTRMESWQEKNLLDAKARTVYKLANNDDKLAKKLHVNVWRAFKKRFNIPRYNSLTTGKYEDGMVWLDNVQLHEVV